MNLDKRSGIYFVSGVCGVGKTTVIKYLKSLLNKDSYCVYDFDARGVPDNADRNWRLEETIYWINVGKENIKDNISTIVCGFSNPEEIQESEVKFILLDADEKTIEERLFNRYKEKGSEKDLKRASGMEVEEFIKDNINFLPTLRQTCINDERCNIIDTVDKSPSEVAKCILKFVVL